MSARRNAVNSYKFGAIADSQEASPHRLIQLLFESALQRISLAKGALLRNETSQKGLEIGRAIAVIGGLRDSLDLSQGEIAQNLDQLYQYMERRLLDANLKNDITKLDEVRGLLNDIKSAWDTIALS